MCVHFSGVSEILTDTTVFTITAVTKNFSLSLCNYGTATSENCLQCNLSLYVMEKVLRLPIMTWKCPIWCLTMTGKIKKAVSLKTDWWKSSRKPCSPRQRTFEPKITRRFVSMWWICHLTGVTTFLLLRRVLYAKSQHGVLPHLDFVTVTWGTVLLTVRPETVKNDGNWNKKLKKNKKNQTVCGLLNCRAHA